MLKYTALKNSILGAAFLGALSAFAENKCAAPVFNSLETCNQGLRMADAVADASSVQIGKSCSHGLGVATFHYTFDVQPKSGAGCNEFSSRLNVASDAYDKELRISSRDSRGFAASREVDLDPTSGSVTPAPLGYGSSSGQAR